METDLELDKIRAKKLSLLEERGVELKRRQELGSNGKPIVLTDVTFDLVRKYPLMLVDFWADWCGPCRLIAPVVEQLARDYDGSVWVGKLDVDKNQMTAQRFEVKSIPSLILFKNGVEVDRVIGAVPRNMIESRLRRHLQNP